MLRPRVTKPKIDGLSRGLEDEVAGYVTAAMGDTVDDVKDAFRDQVRAAGLGDRLANAVRGVTYPNRGRAKSLSPSGWVYAQPSKDGRGAAAIIESYANGAMITPRAGKRWLAIPTEDAPRKRQGDAMTPEEVERKFGHKLQFISPNDKGFHTPSIRRRGIAYLVLKGLAIHHATGKYRNATKRERAGTSRTKRAVSSVIMFTLVPSVKKPRSVDLSIPAAIAEARYDAHLSNRWGS